VSDLSALPALRGAVLGLGMIGRHHARLLQSSQRVQFVGAVDPEGDRFGAVHNSALVYDKIRDLLAIGPVDFAIVAVPTEEHLPAVSAIAGAGISVLVEKPLAATAETARELIATVQKAGVHGAVGHVERFNPALLELRRRVRMGQLGEIFLISTERVGPFPDRVRDVGVVKDLATHDLDLVEWLGGSPVERVAAQTQHRVGREHEDMVLATGNLATGVAFNCQVDWLSPTKVRRTRVLGERGMLVADTLTADLTFFENGEVASEWAESQQFKGVSEGNMTRYALTRREPLLVEIEAFCDLVDGVPDAAVVTLEEGLRTVESAEAVLASAASGETVLLARGPASAGHVLPADPGGRRAASGTPSERT
jgi:predicted dehydrogenase